METRSQHLASENRRLVGLDRYSSYLDGTQVKNSYLDRLEAKSFLESTFDKDIEDAREAARSRVKVKFRERRALAKSREELPDSSSAFESSITGQNLQNKPKHRMKESGKKQLNGEEIYQHLDFYSRSLKSVSINK